MRGSVVYTFSLSNRSPRYLWCFCFIREGSNGHFQLVDMFDIAICQVLFDWEPVKRFLIHTMSRILGISIDTSCILDCVFLILGRKVTFPMGSFGAQTMKYTTILASKLLWI